MSLLQIHTKISHARQAVGQPAWEMIAVDNYIRDSELLHCQYAETVRFNDYARQGNGSVRYYHLLELRNGLTLSSQSPGIDRIISGLYEDRQLVQVGSASKLSNLLPSLSLDEVMARILEMSYVIVSPCEGESLYMARINCIERYDHSIAVLASLRMPLVLLRCHGGFGLFEERLCSHLASREPAFTAFPLDIVDVSMMIQIYSSGSVSSLTLYGFKEGWHITDASVSFL